MLRSLGLPKGSGVAVSVYSCVTVFEAITAAELKCVFIDVDPATYSFDMDSLREKSSQYDAAILIHTFGFPGDITAVKQILSDRPVIEDCSHAFGSMSPNGYVGLNGVAGIFSFNYHKPVSAGGGGLLVVNDMKYISTVKQIVKTISKNSNNVNFKHIVKHIAIAILYRCPWYGIMASTGLLSLKREGALRRQVKPGIISQLDKNLLVKRIMHINQRFTSQRNFIRKISEAIGSITPIDNFLYAESQWNGYLCPIIVDTPLKQKKSLNFFHVHNIDAFVLWPECLRTARRFGYQSGQCPRLEHSLKRMFMLPCYAELKSRQQKYICDIAKKWKVYIS